MGVLCERIKLKLMTKLIGEIGDIVVLWTPGTHSVSVPRIRPSCEFRVMYLSEINFSSLIDFLSRKIWALLVSELTGSKIETSEMKVELLLGCIKVPPPSYIPRSHEVLQKVYLDKSQLDGITHKDVFLLVIRVSQQSVLPGADIRVLIVWSWFRHRVCSPDMHHKNRRHKLFRTINSSPAFSRLTGDPSLQPLSFESLRWSDPCPWEVQNILDAWANGTSSGASET